MKRRRASLENAVRRTIHRIETGDAGLLSDGETFICSVCNEPVKPCEADPHFECAEKIMAGTELKHLLEISRKERNGSPAVCSLCGKTLSPRELSGDPLRELCGTCRTRSRRRNRAASKKERRQ